MFHYFLIYLMWVFSAMYILLLSINKKYNLFIAVVSGVIFGPIAMLGYEIYYMFKNYINKKH